MGVHLMRSVGRRGRTEAWRLWFFRHYRVVSVMVPRDSYIWMHLVERRLGGMTLRNVSCSGRAKTHVIEEVEVLHLGFRRVFRGNIRLLPVLAVEHLALGGLKWGILAEVIYSAHHRVSSRPASTSGISHRPRPVSPLPRNRR